MSTPDGYQHKIRGGDGANADYPLLFTDMAMGDELEELRCVSTLGNNGCLESALKAVLQQTALVRYVQFMTYEASVRYWVARSDLGEMEQNELRVYGINPAQSYDHEDFLYAEARTAIIEGKSLTDFLKEIGNMAADAYRLAIFRLTLPHNSELLDAVVVQQSSLMPSGEMLIEKQRGDKAYTVWVVITKRPAPDSNTSES